MAMRDSELSLLRAIREANEWLTSGEGVDLLYYWPKDVKPELRSLLAVMLGSDEATLIGPVEECSEHRLGREIAVAREVVAARRAGMSRDEAMKDLDILRGDPLTANRMWDVADANA